jgi:hypothetical protein
MQVEQRRSVVVFLMHWLTFLILLAAAAFTCFTAAGSGVSGDVGTVWQSTILVSVSVLAVSPYLFLGWYNFRADTVAQTVMLFLGAVLLAGYGVPLLHARLARHDDALRGLWLLFIPAYQWVGCGLIMLLAFCLRKRQGDRPDRTTKTALAPLLEATDYDRLPWYRRSGAVSRLVIIGIFFAPALVPACIAVLTGPVYYKEPGEDGRLRKWNVLNKIVAVALLLVEVYAYASIVYQ